MLHYKIIPVTHYQQNCTLLWDDTSNNAVLIDAGGDVAELQMEIAKLGVTLQAVWLTHGHLDHAGGAGQIAQDFNVPVIGPNQEDAFWLDGLAMQAQMFGFDAPIPLKISQWLQHGDTLTLGIYQFEVRFAPGHTPGHIVIYSHDLALVWTGDVLFAGSIGRTDFPKGNHEQLLNSIRLQLFTLPDDTKFISGHGKMSTIGHEKRYNPFLN